MRVKIKLYFLFFCFIELGSCSIQPEAIQPGKDNCSFCKMTIADARFGAEVITLKGKIVKFDELHCLLQALNNHTVQKESIRDIYFTDFCASHSLVNAKLAYFLKSDELKSPMGGNVAVFLNQDSLLFTMKKMQGIQVKWDQLFQ